MTRVRLQRFPDIQIMSVKGHQEDGMPEGGNIYCAAVSAITACLVNALILEECDHGIQQEDGFMMVDGPRGERTDAFFDMAMAGFRGFQQKWPERMEIEE